MRNIKKLIEKPAKAAFLALLFIGVHLFFRDAFTQFSKLSVLCGLTKPMYGFLGISVPLLIGLCYWTFKTKHDFYTGKIHNIRLFS